MHLIKTFTAIPLLACLALVACAPTVHRQEVSSKPKTNHIAVSTRHILFFDGTRNVRKSGTNVTVLHDKVDTIDKAPNGMLQKPKYFRGVGTRLTDIVSGAAFGRGVSRDVQIGYEYLRSVYQPGDEIWIFGFSRGAFTGRSLGAFIAEYGVLPTDSSLTVEKLYEDYRTKTSSEVISYLKTKPEAQQTDFQKALLKQSREVDIEFIGVWDTVGTIGLPLPAGRFSRPGNRYHFMEPRSAYKCCRQALAVDEWRPHYSPILWKRWVMEKDMPKDGSLPPLTERDKRYEQRWFVGAHSNVGGGYAPPNELHYPALRWMEQEAMKAGLGIANPEPERKDANLAPVNDSFGAFFPYKIAFWIKPEPRKIQRDLEDKKKIVRGKHAGEYGYAIPLNEVVDDTVHDRVKRGGRNDKKPYGFPPAP